MKLVQITVRMGIKPHNLKQSVKRLKGFVQKWSDVTLCTAYNYIPVPVCKQNQLDYKEFCTDLRSLKIPVNRTVVERVKDVLAQTWRHQFIWYRSILSLSQCPNNRISSTYVADAGRRVFNIYLRRIEAIKPLLLVSPTRQVASPKS